MSKNDLVPITLLCGYLGAGKTTLMNKVLSNQKGYKVAVIVNDIGEINVDERLIAKGANITDTSSIVPLTNGCICCNLKADLIGQNRILLRAQRGIKFCANVNIALEKNYLASKAFIDYVYKYLQTFCIFTL